MCVYSYDVITLLVNNNLSLFETLVRGDLYEDRPESKECFGVVE